MTSNPGHRAALADDDHTVLGNLQAIKAMGIRIALDDFGTGFSSLSDSRRFRFDKIKIDRAFVQGQADDPRVRVILEAILGMCHNLGLATVAEGVETPEQLALLRIAAAPRSRAICSAARCPASRSRRSFAATWARPASTPHGRSRLRRAEPISQANRFDSSTVTLALPPASALSGAGTRTPRATGRGC